MTIKVRKQVASYQADWLPTLQAALTIILCQIMQIQFWLEVGTFMHTQMKHTL